MPGMYGKKNADTTPRHVTVARFSALGDVAMTAGPLYAACRQNPGTRFLMLTRPAYARLFVNPPQNLEVRGIDLHGRHQGMKGMWRLAAEIDTDVFVDLHDVIRTRVLGISLRLRGARTVTFNKSRLAKKMVVRHMPGKHTVTPTADRYAAAFAVAGLKMTPPPYGGIYAGKDPDPSLYAALGVPAKTGPWVGIAPFAAHPGKVYDPARMLQVAKALADDGCTLFLFGGGEKETSVLHAWRDSLPGAVCVAGSGIGMDAELALMAGLDTMVCMDSGNMHMAAMAGTPVVSVWGATHPATGFAPAPCSRAPHVLVQRDMACRPCSVFGNRRCTRGDMACMDIDPQAIADAVRDFVKKQPKVRQ